MRSGPPFIALLLLAACHKGSPGPCNGSPCGPVDVSMITARDNNNVLMGTVDMDDWRGDVTFTWCEEALFPPVSGVDLDATNTVHAFPNPTDDQMAFRIESAAPTALIDLTLVNECLAPLFTWQFSNAGTEFNTILDL